jgi:hypothetical protein
VLDRYDRTQHAERVSESTVRMLDR